MDKKYCPYCMNPVKEGEACNCCGLTEGVYVPRDHHLPLGTVLNNRYLVGRVLGEGGFGITYIGCDLNLELKVAIKEYFPIDRVYRFSKTSMQVSNYSHAIGKYNSGKEKFLREAHTMARLDKQQSIVSVRDFFEENNTAYIVMEYVEGTTLKELVKQRGGRIPARELLDVLEPLFPAITSIHKLGLIHRDISPDNLMLENGKIRLLDFGCAREASVQSETTTIALKQGYAPIEQYQQKGQGPWTDVYALSATIYFCLTGKTLQPAVDRLSEEELAHPRKLGVDLTANQEAALLYGMNMNAKDRFQSMEELYAALYTNEAFTPASYQPISTPKTDLNQSVSFSLETDVEEETAAETATTSEDATATEEATAPEEGVFQKRFNFLKQKFSLKIKQKQNLLILGSCFLAAAVCIACVVVLLGKSGKSKETIASGTLEGTLFANAAVLETFTEEEIQKLMDDDTVSAIRIPKAADDASTVVASTGAITITKPVLVEGNTNISFRDMVILRGENACLWIQGEVTVDCILQTVDGGKIIVDNSNYVHADTLWLENDEDILWILNGQYSLYGEYPDYRDLIVGGKNNLFGNAVSVSDEASLRQATSEDQAVIICGDITLRTELHFHAPIMIREDATVAMQGSGSIIGDGKDFFLWNEGKIQGGLIWINSNTRIINLGEISDGSLGINGPLVNLGELSVDNVWTASVWTNDSHGSIYNVGTLRFQSDMDVVFNTDMVNFGLVAVSFAQDGKFTFCCSSGIENYGEIRVEKGLAVLQSYLRNVTDGRILICDNAVLDNRGVIELSAPDSEWELQCEPQGTLMNAEGAVYYSNGTKGTPEYTPKNGWFYIESLHLLCDVSNIDELTNALQDPEVYGVKLTGEIIWNSAEALTLTKDVVIVEGAGLYMEEGAELIIDGCFLENRGYLKTDGLSLIHRGSLRNYGAGTVEFYAPESTLKLGSEQEERRYKGTDCLLNEGIILNAGKIELYDNALMILKGVLEGNRIQIRDHAYLVNMGQIQWMDGSSFEISGEGRFHNLHRQSWSEELTMHIAEGGVFNNFDCLDIQSGNISVDQGGSFGSTFGYITFGNNLSVLNYGIFTFCQGGDCSLLQGYFENHGYLHLVGPSGFVIDAPYGAVNPACMNNQGEVRIGDSDGYIRIDNGEFTGNEAIYRALE